MTKTTYKQIAEAIEDGREVKFEDRHIEQRNRAYRHRFATIDGEQHEITANCWSSVSSNHELKHADTIKASGNGSYITSFRYELA